MDNQNKLLDEKILKREKNDIILAYVMLVIILLAIAFVVYLKFIKKDNADITTEKGNDYITLNYISDELNNSETLKKYVTNGNDFNCISTKDGIVINYKNNDDTKTININTIGNELEFKIDNKTEEDKLFITDVYKETANIICKYYGNNENACKNVIDGIDETTELDGIRFLAADNQNIVYLDTTKSINISNIQTYNEVTIVDISNKNYQLILNDITIKNIEIVNSGSNIEFSGTIKGDNLNTKSIVVSLYDENDNLLVSNKKEYTEDITIDKFTINFLYDNTLKYDTIKKYSISVE